MPDLVSSRPGRRAAAVLALTVSAVLTVPLLLATSAAAPPSRSAAPAGCESLGQPACLLPFPSDAFTVSDTSTATGRRVSLSDTSTPRNAADQPIDPAEWNRNDGFSPGGPILVQVPGLDVARTGLAPVTDIGASLAQDSPIVLLNAETGERAPYWAELDANATTPEQQLLIIRPAVNLEHSTRYVVALREMKDAAGRTLAAPKAFATYVNGEPADPKDPRRQAMKRMLAELTVAGVKRNDLYLAWDFTVASSQNLTGRMLHMRDDAFARLGENAPAFTITGVTPTPSPGIARRVTGTVTVPKYLAGPGGPGSRLNDPDQDGRPDASGTLSADLVCEVPTRVLAADGTVTPGQASLYGHGLLGRPTEIGAGNVRDMAREHGYVFCATSWIGMAAEDIPYTARIMQDFGRFPALPDRVQQSMLNFLYVGRAMIHPDGLGADPAFQGADGSSLFGLDRGLVYDGNSQGGIIGGALTAVAQDFTRAVLGVPGMNYSTLLNRSVDFDPFQRILDQSYPSKLDQQLVLALAQMLWDRAETNGYAHHMTDDPLPGTPAHRVLLHVAFGDHQVAPVTAEVLARTIGAPVHRPVVAPGWSTDVETAWSIPTMRYPQEGSGLVVWNAGITPAPPATNLPPRAGVDPHSFPRSQSAARVQKATFLGTGAIIDVCNAGPCGVTTSP